MLRPHVLVLTFQQVQKLQMPMVPSGISFARYHGCKLLNLSALPVMPPDPAAIKDTHEASRFRSFAAGYLKREPSQANLQHLFLGL